VTFCGAQPARTPDVVPELAEFLKLNQSSAAWAGKGVLCHAGFLNEYNAVRERILDALAIISPKKPIWVVGHSLGAALATICGLDLATNSHFAHLNLVTFGSPRVGNQKFAEAFNRRAAYSARFANPYDYVTREPQRNPGEAFVKKGSVYCHVKGLISLPFGRADTGRAHSLEGYRAALARMNPRVAVDFTIMNPVHCPPENGDHGLPRVAAAAKPAVDQPPEAPPEQRQRRLPPFPFGPLFRRRA
jgi:pimeloyl-ACP methyl ester carboxylesterase